MYTYIFIHIYIYTYMYVCIPLSLHIRICKLWGSLPLIELHIASAMNYEFVAKSLFVEICVYM